MHGKQRSDAAFIAAMSLAIDGRLTRAECRPATSACPALDAGTSAGRRRA